MACNTILFVSQLIQKCFKRKFSNTSKMFRHYIYAVVLTHFDQSAEYCMQMLGTFFCATRC